MRAGSRILFIGIRKEEIPLCGSRDQFDIVETVWQGTEVLKTRVYDAVVVSIRAAYDGSAEWIERLLAARPFLDLFVLFDHEQVAHSVEGRLRAAGAKAVISGTADQMQHWIESLIAQRREIAARTRFMRN